MSTFKRQTLETDFLRIANRVAWNPKQKIRGKQWDQTIKHQTSNAGTKLGTIDGEETPAFEIERDSGYCIFALVLHWDEDGLTGIIRTSEKVLTKLEPRQQQK